MEKTKKTPVWKRIFLNRFFFLGLDIAIVVASYLLTIIMLNRVITDVVITNEALFGLILPAVVICIPVFCVFNFYSNLWEFVSIKELVYLVLGVLLSSCITYLYALIFTDMGYPYVGIVYFISCVFQLVLVALSRIGYRFAHTVYIEIVKAKAENKRVMIIGAGVAGLMTIREMSANDYLKAKPVVFIDDDKTKQRKRINGVYIYGGREKITEAAKKYRVSEIIIAMPSASRKAISEIAEIAAETKLKVKVMPLLSNMLMKPESKDLKPRDINIEDLLSRDEIVLDNDTISGKIKDKVVLITGGGGSIGSEICRQVTKFAPKKIVIFDIYENNAYELQQEMLIALGDKIDIEVLIGSVRDWQRVDTVFGKYKPAIVFHAAAHKHVPLVETSPAEAVKNNVLGTLNVAKAAEKHGVKDFILISTDKAVNPTNVMGATKRIAEKVIQSMSKDSKTCFAAVRFGNVLGSNGSVIPLFKKQIESGGPVRVTHPEITRFFMTIPEAAQLVLQACSFADGGEIFILDMGQPVKIDSLARNLIKLSGFTPDKDIKVEYVGLRPGEKLYEELLLAEEGITATKHKKIYVAKPVEIAEDYIQRVEALEQELENPSVNIKEKVEELLGFPIRKS